MVTPGSFGKNRRRTITIENDDANTALQDLLNFATGKSNPKSSQPVPVGTLQSDVTEVKPGEYPNAAWVKALTELDGTLDAGQPLTLMIGSGKQGSLFGATAFFDANFNGVVDFLDLNGNQLQDDASPNSHPRLRNWTVLLR